MGKIAVQGGLAGLVVLMGLPFSARAGVESLRLACHTGGCEREVNSICKTTVMVNGEPTEVELVDYYAVAQ